jgi:hypothetical protein
VRCVPISLFHLYFNSFFVIVIIFYCCAEWGYIAAFTKVLTLYQIYHTSIHPLSHSPLSSLPIHHFLEATVPPVRERASLSTEFQVLLLLSVDSFPPLELKLERFFLGFLVLIEASSCVSSKSWLKPLYLIMINSPPTQ